MFRINYTQECTVTMTSRSMFPSTYRNLTWKYQSPAQHPDAPTIPSNICHFWHPTFWPLHPDMLCRPVEKLCPISALPPLPIIKQMYIYINGNVFIVYVHFNPFTFKPHQTNLTHDFPNCYEDSKNQQLFFFKLLDMQKNICLFCWGFARLILLLNSPRNHWHMNIISMTLTVCWQVLRFVWVGTSQMLNFPVRVPVAASDDCLQWKYTSLR